MKAGVQPQHHIDVGQPQVRVHQHDIAALRGDGHGQIGGYGGLAHAALAAGDGDDLDGSRCVELDARVSGLIG
jgi:hypothetical protein